MRLDGPRVYRLLARRGWTQRQASVRAGRRRAWLEQLLYKSRQGKNIQPRTLGRLAQVLNCSVEDLIRD